MDEETKERLRTLKNRMWRYDFEKCGDIDAFFERLIDALIGDSL